MEMEEDKEWLDYRAKFASVYDNANYSGSLQGFVMGNSHEILEKMIPHGHIFSSVLEVGSGTGEHFPYVKHSFDNYIMTDGDAKALEVARRKNYLPASGQVKFELQPAEKLSYPDNTFDRLIAVHILEHLYYPHLAIKEWKRVLKDGGVLSILIPTDPGVMWRLGRHLGPRKNALSQGIAYDFIMAREHVNACNNLVALLKHYFPKRKEHWWPFFIPSVDLNLFYAFCTRIKK